MKRADAQKAIDEAFADALKKRFMTLMLELADKRGARKMAVEVFESGVGLIDEAYAKAISVIEKVFPE